MSLTDCNDLDSVLPGTWTVDLLTNGFFHISLGPDLIADDLLYQVGAKLAGLVDGTTWSEVTIVEPKPSIHYTAFSNEYMPFHNDGLFLSRHPTFLILYCDVQAQKGGENYIVRSDRLYNHLPAELLAYLKTNKIRQTIGDYSAAKYWIDRHPIDGIPVVFYCDPLLKTGDDPVASIPERHHHSLSRLRDFIETSQKEIFQLKTGDLLVLDNYRVLHARNRFEGYRRLRRIVVRHGAVGPN